MPEMVKGGFSPTGQLNEETRHDMGQVGGLSHIPSHVLIPRPILYPRTVGRVNSSLSPKVLVPHSHTHNPHDSPSRVHCGLSNVLFLSELQPIPASSYLIAMHPTVQQEA